MKKLTTAVLLLASLSANAELTTAKCKDYYLIADAIMSARQQGVSIVELVDSLSLMESKAWAGIAMNVAISAYEEPIFKSEPNKNEAVNAFSTRLYIDCISAIE